MTPRHTLVLGLLIAAFLGCGEKPGAFVVRVGSSVLTEAMIDSSLQAARNQNQREAFIQDWIQSEVLYQKALQDGLDKDREYRRQIDQIQRELLAQRFLENELEKSLTVTDGEVETYYEANKSLFLSTDDQVKTEYFMTRDRLKARRTAAQFGRMSRLGKKDFIDIITQSAADTDLVGASDFLPRPEFDPRAVKFLFAKNAADEVVGPIRTADGYYGLWHVVEIRFKGAPRSLDEVRKDIEIRLRMGKRKQKIDELIKRLKTELPVEYGR